MLLYKTADKKFSTICVSKRVYQNINEETLQTSFVNKDLKSLTSLLEEMSAGVTNRLGFFKCQ